MSSDIRKKLEKIYTKIDKIAVYGKEKTQDYYLLVDDFVNKGEYQNFELCLLQYYFIDISGINSIDTVKKKTWPDIMMQTKASFLKRLSKLYKTKNVYQQGFDIFSIEPKYLNINLSSPLSSTYSVIGLTPSIGIIRDGDLIKLNINNDSIGRVNIYKASWGVIDNVNVPVNTEEFQNINVIPGIHTYDTEIVTSYNQNFLIKTEERYVPGVTLSVFREFNYKLELVRNPFLGQIHEIESIDTTDFYSKNTKFFRLKKDIKTSLKIDKVGSIESIIVSDENPDLNYDSNLILKYSQAIDILLS